MNAKKILNPAPPSPGPAAGCPAGGLYRPSSYEAGESVGYLMRKIVTRLAQEIERQMEPHDLTNAQWVPLLKLRLGLASTVAELARECELDAGAMTRLLDRVEAKGLCRRVRSSEDRRVVNLELTPEGQGAADQVPAVLCDAQNALLAGFSIACMRRMVHRCRRYCLR